MACIDPGAQLAGFTKRTFIHCYIQNMKALGLVVSKKMFLCFSQIVNLWELMTPGVGSFMSPGTWLAGFVKRTTKHDCYTQNMKALGLVVLKIFVSFFFFTFANDARGAWPVWTQGTRLAGLIKRTFMHCFIHVQNRKALVLVVSENTIFYPRVMVY